MRPPACRRPPDPEQRQVRAEVLAGADADGMAALPDERARSGQLPRRVAGLAGVAAGRRLRLRLQLLRRRGGAGASGWGPCTRWQGSRRRRCAGRPGARGPPAAARRCAGRGGCPRRAPGRRGSRRTGRPARPPNARGSPSRASPAVRAPRSAGSAGFHRCGSWQAPQPTVLASLTPGRGAGRVLALGDHGRRGEAFRTVAGRRRSPRGRPTPGRPLRAPSARWIGRDWDRAPGGRCRRPSLGSFERSCRGSRRRSPRAGWQPRQRSRLPPARLSRRKRPAAPRRCTSWQVAHVITPWRYRRPSFQNSGSPAGPRPGGGATPTGWLVAPPKAAPRAWGVAGAAELLDRRLPFGEFPEGDVPAVLPVAAAAEAPGGHGGGPGRAGRAVGGRGDRDLARVAEQAGVGLAGNDQARRPGAAAVGAVAGRAGEFAAGARDVPRRRGTRRRCGPGGRTEIGCAPSAARRVERVLGRVAVQAERLAARDQLRRPPGCPPCARWQERQTSFPPGAKNAPERVTGARRGWPRRPQRRAPNGWFHSPPAPGAASGARGTGGRSSRRRPRRPRAGRAGPLCFSALCIRWQERQFADSPAIGWFVSPFATEKLRSWHWRQSRPSNAALSQSILRPPTVLWTRWHPRHGGPALPMTCVALPGPRPSRLGFSPWQAPARPLALATRIRPLPSARCTTWQPPQSCA